MIGTSMNSYILRVYRLSRKKPHTLVGLVEEVGVKEQKAFTNVQELWEILSHPKETIQETKKRRIAETERMQETKALEKMIPGKENHSFVHILEIAERGGK